MILWLYLLICRSWTNLTSITKINGINLDKIINGDYVMPFHFVESINIHFFLSHMDCTEMSCWIKLVSLSSKKYDVRFFTTKVFLFRSVHQTEVLRRRALYYLIRVQIFLSIIYSQAHHHTWAITLSMVYPIYFE